MSDLAIYRRLVRQFWCETCHAQPGEHCLTRSGRQAVTEHDPRREAFSVWVHDFVADEASMPHIGPTDGSATGTKW